MGIEWTFACNRLKDSELAKRGESRFRTLRLPMMSGVSHAQRPTLSSNGVSATSLDGRGALVPAIATALRSRVGQRGALTGVTSGLPVRTTWTWSGSDRDLPSSDHNPMGASAGQCPGGEQVWRYSSVTVWRGVCLTDQRRHKHEREGTPSLNTEVRRCFRSARPQDFPGDAF